MTRVLVCGGRGFLDEDFLFRQLDAFHQSNDGPITVLMHGKARGADTFAGRWAKLEGGITVLEFDITKKEWDTLGPSAGPLRNQRMLDKGDPDVVLAFKGGKGTLDMVNRARAAGVRVELIGWGQPGPGGRAGRVLS